MNAATNASTDLAKTALTLSVAQQEALVETLNYSDQFFGQERTEKALIKKGMVKAVGTYSSRTTPLGRKVAEFVRKNGIQQPTNLTPSARKVFAYLKDYLRREIDEYDGTKGYKGLGKTYETIVAKRVEMKLATVSDAIRRLRANDLIEAGWGTDLSAKMTKQQLIKVEALRAAYVAQRDLVATKLEELGIDADIDEGSVELSVSDLFALLTK
ncbi:MAG: hypothetical protein ACYTFG_00085 [Planctomycetota bacterium]